MSSLFFVTFLLTFQLFRIIRVVISKGVDSSTIFELVGHIAVSFIPLAIPLSALFATIFTLNKLSEDSEIVAMRSFGATKGKLIFPFMLIGVFIAFALFGLNRQLIPKSKTIFRNTLIRLTSRGVLTEIKPGQFFTEIPSVTLFAERVVDGKMEEVFIRQGKGDSEQVIFAKRGALIKQTLGELQNPAIRMHLEEGNITKTKGGGGVEKFLFKEYDFPIHSGGEAPGFVTKDSMRTNSELRKVIRTRKSRRAELLAKDKLKISEQAEINHIKNRLPKSQLEYWTRYNTPLQVLIFILLGFSLGIKKGRGRQRNSGAIGLMVLIGYYATFFIGVSLARKGIVPPFVTIFTPTFLATAIGVKFYKNLDWMS